jgi:3-hydroxyisobutyrate dehydrogenase
MKVGWIGLGSIGTQMALRVLQAGHELKAYDRGVGKAELAAMGVPLTAEYAAVANDCDVLGVCVFSDAQLRECLLDGGALAVMKRGSVVAIHTTGSPKLARELGEAAPQGVQILDACFSGSADDTARGELTLMLGGDDAALEAARPVISTYASRINHVGALGAGQTIKLLNNLLFATNLKQAAEIVAMAQAQGLDPLRTAQVICQSSGGSMAMGLFRDATPAQIIDVSRKYMTKDVEAAALAAADTGIDIETFAATIRYYQPD